MSVGEALTQKQNESIKPLTDNGVQVSQFHGVMLQGYDSTNARPQALKLDDEGNLLTKLDGGTVLLGGVKIEDEDSGTRVNVELDSTKNAMYVKSESLATSAKQDTVINRLDSLVGLDIPEHDYISLGYTGSNLTSVIYKIGGSGGTTVATLTLAYDGSDNLISVTKT